MQSESSAIARKIRDLIIIQNLPKQNISQREEPGVMKNIILIGLMGAAVFFTQMTLFFVNWVRRLGG